jgi:hypothetical protein
MLAQNYALNYSIANTTLTDIKRIKNITIFSIFKAKVYGVYLELKKGWLNKSKAVLFEHPLFSFKISDLLLILDIDGFASSNLIDAR